MRPPPIDRHSPFLICLLLAVALLVGGLAMAPALEGAKPKTAVQSCTNDGCHNDVVNRKFMHGPAAQRKCLSCHVYDEPREHRFKLALPEEQLCGDCHTMKHRTVVHAPVKEGNCVGCHDPHGSDHRGILIADPTRGLCLSCHEGDFSTKKFIHGPVAAGTCILCHEPHSSWGEMLLVETPQELCVGCHSEMLPRADRDRYVHAPLIDNCGACHDAHASDQKFQLHQVSQELCLSCHEEVSAAMAASHTVHGAMVTDDGCTSCHDAHFSQLPKLQRLAQPDSCLACHDRPLETAGGRVLANMAQLLKDNPHHHGPIRDGECTACHQPHAGERFRLLTAAYPPEFYASFDIRQYELCFNCHLPELVLERDGTGLTRFRDGDVNLHWLHVNQQKGRTCRACHEVHASSNPFHIRDAVPFGDRGWMLEINYEQAETGGSCSPGCHATATYTHGEAEGEGVSAKEADHGPARL